MKDAKRGFVPSDIYVQGWNNDKKRTFRQNTDSEILDEIREIR